MFFIILKITFEKKSYHAAKPIYKIFIIYKIKCYQQTCNNIFDIIQNLNIYSQN